MSELSLSELYYSLCHTVKSYFNCPDPYENCDACEMIYNSLADSMFDGFIDLITNSDYWVHGEDYDYGKE